MTNGKISGTAPNLVIWANAKSLLDIKYHTNETHTHTEFGVHGRNSSHKFISTHLINPSFRNFY